MKPDDRPAAVGSRAWGGRRVQAFTALVLRTWGTICHLCWEDGADTADHIIPRSKGGPAFDLDNARPAHGPCNYSRGDLDLDEWRRRHPQPVRPALAPSREW